MKKTLLALTIALSAITCVDYIQPKKSKADYVSAPVCRPIYNNGWYVGTWCNQRICNAYGCRWGIGWWL